MNSLIKEILHLDIYQLVF